jgi:hypothetical protein
VQQQEFSDMAALPLIVFDVNETLLDLETMEPTFQRIFGDQGAMRLWFANFIMYSAALTVAGRIERSPQRSASCVPPDSGSSLSRTICSKCKRGSSSMAASSTCSSGDLVLTV